MDLLSDKKRPRKKKGTRKFGRNKRAATHRTGGYCGLRNCVKLGESRVWNAELGTYVPR